MATHAQTTQKTTGNTPFVNPGGVKRPEPRLGLPTGGETKVIEHLEQVLADTYTLYLKTQNAHWNVTGPLFHSLHQVFETQYTEMIAAIDTIAERIRVLGSFVPATLQGFSGQTSIKEWKEPPQADVMVSDLVRDNEAVVAALRGLVAAADANGDEATLDLAVGRLRVHEKAAWMLRAHLE